MRSYKLVFTLPAQRDLNQILDYYRIELCAPEAARSLLSKVKSLTRALSTPPARFPLAADKRLAEMGIRKALVDNYIIFFQTNEESGTVCILRLLHMRRNWLDIL